MVGAAKPDWVLLVASLLSPPAAPEPVASGPEVVDAAEADEELSPLEPEPAGALAAGVMPQRSLMLVWQSACSSALPMYWVLHRLKSSKQMFDGKLLT